MAKKSQFRVGGKLWDSSLGRFVEERPGLSSKRKAAKGVVLDIPSFVESIANRVSKSVGGDMISIQDGHRLALISGPSGVLSLKFGTKIDKRRGPSLAVSASFKPHRGRTRSVNVSQRLFVGAKISSSDLSEPLIRKILDARIALQ